MIQAQVSISLTVFFEAPFWRGIYEWQEEDCYKAYKFTFGSEPKANEVYEVILKKWNTLYPQEVKGVGGLKNKKTINPKRMQREVKKQVREKGIGTKAQQALKAQHEAGKLQHKSISRAEKEAEKALKFELKQEKKKQKHKGH